MIPSFPSWVAVLCTRDVLLRLMIAGLSRVIVALYRLQRVPVWRSFDGRITPVTRMRDGHLCNTIRLLERGNQARHPVLPFMRAEAERRGLVVYPYAVVESGRTPSRYSAGSRRKCVQRGCAGEPTAGALLCPGCLARSRELSNVSPGAWGDS